MKTAIVKITGTAPYVQSKYINFPKLPGEKPEAYDERLWRYHAHFEGEESCLAPLEKLQGVKCFIPSQAFKFALDRTAKFQGEKIPGKGQATWSKNFASGVRPARHIAFYLPGDMSTLTMTGFMANSDGVRGSGSRVFRRFPVWVKWGGEVEFSIWDDLITEEKFEDYIRKAGILTGIGQGRPENSGFNGTFKAEIIKFERVLQV